MPQFPVRSEDISGGLVRIEDRATLKHLRAQRAQPGEELFLVDEAHARYRAALTAMDKAGADLKVLERLPAAKRDHRIILCQSLLKRERMDLVVEKAVELGVDEIKPFTSARSEVYGDIESKWERWKRVADAAVSQSSRPWPVTLRPVVEFPAMLEDVGAGAIMLWEAERGLAFRDALAGAGPEVTLVIGPEGGFSGEEAREFRHHGGTVASFGESILRAETAAIAAVSATLFGLGAL